MGKSIFGSEESMEVASVWGRILLSACIATAIIYTLTALFACRRKIMGDIRWLFVALAFFVIGLIHAFFTLAIMSIAIATVFYTFGRPLYNGEMVTYAGIMVVVTVFFACGRKTILYAL